MGCGLECGLLLSLCTMKNFLAIGFIWICCALAWVVLGSTLVYRSGEASGELNTAVRELWGPPRRQQPPSALWHESKKVKERITNYDAQGRPVIGNVERDYVVEHPVPLRFSELYAGYHRDRIELPTVESERGARLLQGARRKRQMG